MGLSENHSDSPIVLSKKLFAEFLCQSIDGGPAFLI